MSIRSYINSPFNTSRTTSSGLTATTPVVPAAPVPALEIVNLKPDVVAEMPATIGGAINKVVALYDAAGVTQTLFVPAGTYNATIYLPIQPQGVDGFIGTVQAVIVNNATNLAVLTSNTVSFVGGQATDYETLIFDTEDLITIPADITVRLEVWYGNSTQIFDIVNVENPFDPLLRWNSFIRFKTASPPLVPPLTVPALTVPPLTN